MIDRKKIWVIAWLIMGSFQLLLAQSGAIMQQGEVSFVTSTSVYVRFEDTSSIEQDDTLYVQVADRLVPALVLVQKSSLSCVARSIIDRSYAKGDLVVHRPASIQKTVGKTEVLIPKIAKRDPVDGSISFTSYINSSSAAGTNIRNMVRLRLSADEINNSRFSFNTYMIYRQNTINQTESSRAIDNGLFNVYSASLSYRKDSSYVLSIGRQFSRRVASLGMIDGLLAEKQFGKMFAGAIVGFRPDILTNDFNSDLFQYGGYIGAAHSGGKNSFEVALGVMEQQNKGNTDRRYLYFQGSTNIGRRFSLFSSAEMDLYTLDSTLQTANSQLTNIHVASNYRVNRKIRISLSYDSRRSIVYYESFQPFLEDILTDTEARQVLRGRLNVKVSNRIRAGIGYGKRFQSSMRNASDNFSAFVVLRKPPWIKGILSANLNANISPYLTTAGVSFRHSNTYFDNRLRGTVFLRSVIYSNIPARESIIIQQFVGASGRYLLKNNYALGGMLEFSIRKAESRSRINIQVSKRF
jgi:hypothetical protein